MLWLQILFVLVGLFCFLIVIQGILDHVWTSTRVAYFMLPVFSGLGMWFILYGVNGFHLWFHH